MNISELIAILLFMNGFMLALAFLIRECQKRLDQGKTWEVQVGNSEPQGVPAGSTVMQGLARHRLFLPSACGGKGTCGACRCTVVKDAPNPTAIERSLLTWKELSGGMRLACQLRVETPLKLELPKGVDVSIPIQAVIEAIEPQTVEIRRFFLRLSESARFAYHPGQYIQLLREDNDEWLVRAYSLASIPADGLLEIHVRRVEDGAMTEWLFERKNGDALLIAGPFGDFVLDPSESGPLVLVAGGIGYSPFRGLLRQLQSQGFVRETWLFLGAGREPDLYDLPWLNELARLNPRFHLIPVVQFPESDPPSVMRGLVTDALEQCLAGDLAGLKPALSAYLCGPAAMIAVAEQCLLKAGCSRSSIHFDTW